MTASKRNTWRPLRLPSRRMLGSPMPSKLSTMVPPLRGEPLLLEARHHHRFGLWPLQTGMVSSLSTCRRLSTLLQFLWQIFNLAIRYSEKQSAHIFINMFIKVEIVCWIFIKVGIVYMNESPARPYPRMEYGATLAREPGLEVQSTTTGGLWILNRGTESITLKAGELFGFNIGSWVEVASGRIRFVFGNSLGHFSIPPLWFWMFIKLTLRIPAATCATTADYVPFCVSADSQLVCLVTAGANPTKEVMSLADVMCQVTRRRGVTEVKLVDHNLRPKVKARLDNKFWIQKSSKIHQLMSKSSWVLPVSFFFVRSPWSGWYRWKPNCVGLQIRDQPQCQHSLLQTEGSTSWPRSQCMSCHPTGSGLVWQVQPAAALSPLRCGVGRISDFMCDVFVKSCIILFLIWQIQPKWSFVQMKMRYCSAQMNSGADWRRSSSDRVTNQTQVSPSWNNRDSRQFCCEAKVDWGSWPKCLLVAVGCNLLSPKKG